MKKAMILLLSVLVALNVFVSCSQEQNTANEPTRMVQFNDGSGITKALNRAPEGLKTGELYWSYTAEKVDDSGFTTGATIDKKPVCEQGLGTAVGPFSQGEWKFTLYGYTDASRLKLAWTGSTTTILSLKGGASSPASVAVDVHRLRTPGVNGIIRVPEKLEVHNEQGKIGNTYNQTVQIYKGSDLLKFEAHSGTDYEVESGLYKVVVTAVSEDGSIEYATNEIAVNVYDNLVTTVGGFLDETTLNTQFSTNEKGETVATSPSVAISKNEEPTVLQVQSTPVDDHSDVEKPTSVSFPKGAFSDTAENATITVKPSTLENANAKSEFLVESNEAVVGAIDIDVMVDGQKTSTFNDNLATVTTFIQPGLPQDGVVVKYHGTEKNVKVNVVSYDSTDGKLVFTTNHFSEYYVVVQDVSVYNSTTDKLYASFKDAVEQAVNLDKLTVLKDLDIKAAGDAANPIHIGGSGNAIELTLDMNGHTVTMDRWTSLCIYDGDVLTVKGNGKIDSHGRVFDVKPKNTGNGGKLVIENGTYVTTNQGVAGFTPMIFFGNESTIIINDGTFTCTNTEGSYQGQSVFMPIIQANGTNLNKKYLTINGGEFNGDLVYLPSDGEFTINDGTFNSTYGCVYQKCGVLNINGGRFFTSADGNWQHNGSGYENTGSTVVVEACNYPSGNPTVNISKNAEFYPFGSSDLNHVNYPVLVIDWRKDASSEYDKAVTAGIEIPYQYTRCTGNETLDYNAINTVVNAKGKISANVTTADGIVWALEGKADEITLDRDIVVSNSISIFDSVKINLNGHTITNAENMKSRTFWVVSPNVDMTIDGSVSGSRMLACPEGATQAEQSYGFVDIKPEALNCTLLINGGEYAGDTDRGGFFRARPNDDEVSITLNNVNATTNHIIVQSDDHNVSKLFVNGGKFSSTSYFKAPDTNAGSNPDRLNVFMAVTNDFYDNPNDEYTMEFRDVIINSNGWLGVAVAGGKALFENCHFTVDNKASIKDYIASCIGVSWNGHADIKGGEYVSNHNGNYIFNSGGTMNIEDAKITAPVPLRADVYKTPDNNGNTRYNADIYVKSGDIKGTMNETNPSGTNLKATIHVMGGTYDVDPTPYLVEGYQAVKDAQVETWTVSLAPTP